MNEIEVRWELPGGRLVWWKAAVNHLRYQSRKRIANATAFLEYEAAYGFPKSRYQVRFKNSRLLEHIPSEDNNSISAWRVRHVMKKQNTFREASHKIDEDMNHLRKRIVRNTEQLEALQRTVEMQQCIDSPQEMDFRYRREREVLGFLIRRMANELRSSPRRPVRPHQMQVTSSSVCESITQGLSRTTVRIFADCEQRVFEGIAKRIHTVSDVLHSEPLFKPSYELTQLPREGCNLFSVYFGSVSDLCECKGIHSVSDRLVMMCRYGMRKGEGIMRVLGTVNEDLGEEAGAMEFFLGSSCGHNYGEIPAGGDQSRQSVPVILRETSTWNAADRRYESPLRTETRQFSRKMRHACLEEGPGTGASFQMRWRRAADVSNRLWSCNITHSDIIFGQLEIVLPCIIVSGSVLCDEYTTCMTESLLRKATL